MSAFDIVIGIVVVMLGWIIIKTDFIYPSKRRSLLTDLERSGFKADHVLDARNVKIAFDDTSKSIAFIYHDKIKKYNYNDITQWQWHWVEKNAQKSKNQIHFFLRDKETPLIKADFAVTSQAELWNAKLSAIFG